MKHERVMGVRKSRRLIEAAQKLEMEGQDWIFHLPSDILMSIILRLPPGDIMRCKCVCKTLLELLVSQEFVKSHLSEAVPGLAILEWYTSEPSKTCRIVEFVEKDLNNDEHRWGVVLNFKLPSNYYPVHSSADGLLFLHKHRIRASAPILCNPLTNDYIKLPYPYRSASCPFMLETYGFGVSRISCQYKVVRMSMEREDNTPVHINLIEFECQVYTVGTGRWRRIDNGSRLKYNRSTAGAFVNGNLHWLIFNDLQSNPQWISCFDLETESFSTFPAPPFVPFICRNLSVMGDCLCICDNGEDDEYTGGEEIVIWLMKEYGDGKSWTKEFVIRKGCDTDYLGHIQPLKIFEDGDILMNWGNLLYYSNKTKTIREINVFGKDSQKHNLAVVYSPSFIPLRNFAMENAISPSDLGL